ncbi:hypothetical protein GCE86_14225 [Micromonospora terminaliae]|uniref:Uncharacterized protein n=1 Tax=Micromonospora terminaliae TaxID=1914461 RepID=A0AAJ2ZE22_9ACTN|nr:hypothetical protein [Micromonospora terminaliae]NES27158.1 hypothetical protein [Micromonospora terminaliae]QGL48079.1 hypothetical protein GCE86_14225 [Micromonospora terminaliae]
MASSQNVDLMGNVRALVEDALPGRLPGARVAPDRDEIVVAVPGGRARVSLTPLLRACRDQPRQAWPELVADWVAAIRRELPDSVSADLGPVDIAQLRLRLTPAAATAEADDYLAVPYAGHFTATVVVNRPERLDLLTLAQAARLGREPAELVRTAVRQTVAHELTTLDVRDHELPGGGSVRLLAADGNPFVTTALMSVQRFLPEAAEHGALVAAPQYSAVLLHRVDHRVQDAAVALHRLVASMVEAATDPCSEQVFWWHGGEFHPVRVVPGEAGGAVQVRLPEALAPVVARLDRPTG